MPVNANSSRTDAFRRLVWRPGMSKVSEYRQHAKECQALAHRARCRSPTIASRPRKD
jgi:hypothetical protein